MITYEAKTVDIEVIRRFGAQPREYFNPDEIAARAASMKVVGQQTAITVEPVTGDPKHQYEIIDGESRWRAAKKAGIVKMLVLVRSVPFKSMPEKHLASLVANFNRSEHTPMEISNALNVQIKNGMTQTKLAVALGKHEMWVSQYLSLQKLHPKIQAQLSPDIPDKKRLSPTAAFVLAQAPLDRQLEALAAATRKDGRVTMASIQEVLLGTGLKRRQQRPSKRRAAIEGALRSIGLAGARIKIASRTEAQEVFDQLKAAGELGSIDSISELMEVLGQTIQQFPDLPILKDDPTDEEILIHQEQLRHYWLAKADPRKPDQLLISIAYPPWNHYLKNKRG